MSFKLAIFNPSDSWRSGHITTSWQPIHEQTKIPPEELVLTDDSGNQLPCQVDTIDPSDPSQDILVFSLAESIKPGPEDYTHPSTFVFVERDSARPEGQGGAYLETPHGENGVKLYNRRLEIWFNLIPELEPNGPKQYAGSATSVILDGRELLDSTQKVEDWLGGPWPKHDPEKRCMQVDQVQLMRPAWEVTPYQMVPLSNQPYRLIHQSSGPVRASFTIASVPFNYNYSDPVTHREIDSTYRLYRVISLYAGADYLAEEMFVKGTVEGETGAEDIIYLHFTPRYFMHINLGHRPPLHRFDHVPDWLAVGSELMWYPGYGFATDVHTAPVVRQDESHRFSWELHPCKYAKCIHIFMRGQRWVDSWAGDYWYKYIYKPLKAKIHGD